jgi:hypothetical protein
MKAMKAHCNRCPHRRYTFTLAVLIATSLTAACGSGSSITPIFSGNTSVTVLSSSTANDQLSQFEINFNSFALVNKNGNTVTLFTTPQDIEFIHLNGRLEPVVTVSVPQGVYTSAEAGIGYSLFTCINNDPSSNMTMAEFVYNTTPSSQITVNLPAPITITGNTLGLALNMQVAQSASYSNCGAGANFSITPTFNLSTVDLASSVSEPQLDGEVTSISAATNSFSVALAGGIMLAPGGPTENGATIPVTTNANTIYQGISNLSSLTVGTFVDLDAVVQPDGSQLASRIAVEDADSADLSVSTGPILTIAEGQPTLVAFGRQHQGYLWDSGLAGNLMQYNFGSAVFQISGQFTNLGNLPFVPAFNAANMFAGQDVYVTTHALTLSNSSPYFPASTVTLMPQTINGTVNASAAAGSFTAYTVTLASYDLIPNLAVQPGQTRILTNPNTVTVYVDGNTQLLNTDPLVPGSTLRFYGLVFNDNGALQMDCARVLDGVTATAQSNSMSQQSKAQAKTVHRIRTGRLEQTITATVAQPQH